MKDWRILFWVTLVILFAALLSVPIAIIAGQPALALSLFMMVAMCLVAATATANFMSAHNALHDMMTQDANTPFMVLQDPDDDDDDDDDEDPPAETGPPKVPNFVSNN